MAERGLSRNTQHPGCVRKVQFLWKLLAPFRCLHGNLDMFTSSGSQFKCYFPVNMKYLESTTWGGAKRDNPEENSGLHSTLCVGRVLHRPILRGHLHSQPPKSAKFPGTAKAPLGVFPP